MHLEHNFKEVVGDGSIPSNFPPAEGPPGLRYLGAASGDDWGEGRLIFAPVKIKMLNPKNGTGWFRFVFSSMGQC